MTGFCWTRDDSHWALEEWAASCFGSVFSRRPCVALAAILLSGCVMAPPAKKVEAPAGVDAEANTPVLDARINEFAVTFAALVEQSANQIASSTDDPDLRRRALLWKANATATMRQACYRYSSTAGAYDAWVFARQMQRFFESGAGAGAFGPYQNDAIGVSRDLAARAREIARTFAESPAAFETLEQERVEPWVHDFPIRDFSFTRESPIAPFATYAGDTRGFYEKVASLESLVLRLSTQSRVYMAEMPKQLGWRVELMVHELGLPALITELERTLRAVTDASVTAGRLIEVIRTEREAVTASLEQHVATMTELVTTERTAMMNDTRRILDSAVDRLVIGIGLLLLVGWVMSLAVVLLCLRRRPSRHIQSF